MQMFVHAWYRGVTTTNTLTCDVIAVLVIALDDCCDSRQKKKNDSSDHLSGDVHRRVFSPQSKMAAHGACLGERWQEEVALHWCFFFVGIKL